MNKLARHAVTTCLRRAPARHAALEATLLATPPRACEVAVTLVDDAEIQELNGGYRRKPQPTDVLSFAQHEGHQVPTASGPDVVTLGDIVISIATAARQATGLAHSLDHEVAFLALHGTLHLLGYDHHTAAERRAMWQWQEEIHEVLSSQF